MQTLNGDYCETKRVSGFRKKKYSNYKSVYNLYYKHLSFLKLFYKKRTIPVNRLLLYL